MGCDYHHYHWQALTYAVPDTVLVIEAGRADDNPNIRLPFGATFALNTSLLWSDYVCQPEPALNNKTWNTRVAQVLGGGSVVNGKFETGHSRFSVLMMLRNDV